MSNNRYIDFNFIKKAPNKYNITPKDIPRLRVLDWDKLKELTWLNKAMPEPCWCHIEGSDNGGYFGDDVNEFWIGFYKNGKVDYHFPAMMECVITFLQNSIKQKTSKTNTI